MSRSLEAYGCSARPRTKEIDQKKQMIEISTFIFNHIKDTEMPGTSKHHKASLAYAIEEC